MIITVHEPDPEEWTNEKVRKKTYQKKAREKNLYESAHRFSPLLFM